MSLSNGEAWAAGSSGTLLHYDRFTWSPVPSGTTCDLTSLWAADPQEVWAVSDCGEVLRFDGAEVRPVDSGVQTWLVSTYGFRESAASGSGPSDLWIVGRDGLILRRVGERFVTVPGPFGAGDVLYGIWGTSPRDLWVVGEDALGQGIAARWDGVRFTRQQTPVGSAGLSGVWGSASDSVWLVGDKGTLLRWDGAALRKMETPAEAAVSRFTGIHGLPTGEAWIVGIMNGRAYRLSSTGALQVHGTAEIPFLLGVHQSGSAAAWAVGTSGALARWDGSRWSAYYDRAAAGFSPWTAAHAFAGGEVWAVGAFLGPILRFRGDGFSSLRGPPGPLLRNSSAAFVMYGLALERVRTSSLALCAAATRLSAADC